MEILTASLLSTCILFIFLIALRLIDLIKHVNKQQEQIDDLNIKCSQLASICNDITIGVLNECKTINSDLKEIKGNTDKLVKNK